MPRVGRVTPEERSPQRSGCSSSRWELDNTLKASWVFRTKERIQCVCEGGGSCSREDPAKQQGENAIAGLHCSWVGDSILAMARPWQSYVVQHGLVDAFVRSRIGMILNLQEVGEHENCGPPGNPGNLPSSGFSYDPDTFMAAGIGFYNFSWRDMGVPDLDKMMDIVQVMDYVISVEQRRVAVHCHAGLGRTGLVIACYMVFAGTHGADAAVASVRADRPGAVQTRQQVEFVGVFGQYLAYLRSIFREQATSAAGPAAAAAESSAALLAPLHAASASAVPALEGEPNTQSGKSKTETYGSGLTVVRPPLAALSKTGARTQSLGTPKRAHTSPSLVVAHSADESAGRLPRAGVGSEKFAPGCSPSLPFSYAEALRRQRRVMHGPGRRTYLHVHRFIKHAVFAVIYAARTHARERPEVGPGSAAPRGPVAARTARASRECSKDGSPCGSLRAGGGGAAMGAGAADDPTSSGSGAPRSPRTPDSGKGGEARSEIPAPRPPPLPPPDAASTSRPGPLPPSSSFARVVSGLVGGAGPHAPGQAAVGPQVAHAVARAKRAANAEDFEPISAAPLDVALRCIEDFFSGFDASAPSLSAEALAWMAKAYTSLPFAPTPGVQHSSQMAAAAHVLSPLPGPDQELLLLCAALLKHVARASGPGCERDLVAINRWVSRLLLGSTLSATLAIASDWVASFLWCLLRNDAAYAAAILVRKQRLERRKAAGLTTSRSESNDLAAMSVSASASAPTTANTPDASHRSLPTTATTIAVTPAVTPTRTPTTAPGSLASASPSVSASAAFANSASDAVSPSTASSGPSSATTPLVTPALKSSAGGETSGGIGSGGTAYTPPVAGGGGGGDGARFSEWQQLQAGSDGSADTQQLRAPGSGGGALRRSKLPRPGTAISDGGTESTSQQSRKLSGVMLPALAARPSTSLPTVRLPLPSLRTDAA
ncbi:hypothetical protein FOA52_005103 [Chlamydomonas sp. UWO 241]|nr:hypothetical protein FOA52_005103 [Chlamydomonas sp. UWO 241]